MIHCKFTGSLCSEQPALHNHVAKRATHGEEPASGEAVKLPMARSGSPHRALGLRRRTATNCVTVLRLDRGLQAAVHFSVVLGKAKELASAARPVSDRPVRSFAELGMTRMSVGGLPHVLSV